MSDERDFRGRIVVGHDGSDAASVALEWAIEESRLHGRGLTLLHAVVPPVATGGLGVGLPPSLDIVDDLAQQARTQLSAIAHDIALPDVMAAVRIGAPSGVLLEASEDAHLIVVGTRGHGGFRGLLLGSVSGQVAAHAACPVAVPRTRPAADASAVVVGIDGSPAAEAALGFAFEEASRRGWSLIAVHAWDVPAYDLLVVPNGPVPVPLSDVADDEVRLTAETLAGFRTDYPDVDVEERLVRAPAVQALVDASSSAAMVVVGTHGHGPAMGALLGSVSNGLLHKARVPVVVVPPAPDEEDAA
jgi:nucleotide-binding universal stress UspA family protein